MPPCSSFHSHACLRNSSRVRSVFFIPFEARRATTFASVAIDAWSVPGTQRAFLPSIRARRIRMSWIVLLSMCPIWSTPVTFGGGITIVYGSRLSGVDLNKSCFSQYSYHFPSTSSGLYFDANSFILSIIFNFYIKMCKVTHLRREFR